MPDGNMQESQLLETIFTTKINCNLKRNYERQLEAANRTDRYKQLMDLEERNRTEFYQLIKQQRNPANTATSPLLYKTKIYNDDNSICNAWADYFEELSTPISHSDFDGDHEDLVTNDIGTLTTMFENNNVKNLPTITIEEVSNTIVSFKNGKSPDQEGISAEHLKYGGPTLISILTIIINYIFKNLYIPDFLKAGIHVATPVLKKKGKQNTDPNSYRKITVTNLIGKVIEKIHLQHNYSLIMKQQSRLQKVFTKNEMPIAAALILTELITEANKTRSPLYVALMNAKKTFDILWHAGLLREMYYFGLTGDNWTFFKNLYEDVTSRIKWKGITARPVLEQQGVRQGGVWPPSAHKIFINNLLATFEQNQVGMHLGHIYCGIPTVADDVTLISSDPYELQAMLDIQAAYANKQRYILSDQRSTILVFNDNQSKTWQLNSANLTVSASATHLGIERDSSSSTGTKQVSDNRITIAPRTVYSMIGAGLHGLNGLNPQVSSHLIQIYVLPRLMYGLDVINISGTDIDKLELYYHQLIKRLQHLPRRTANSTALLLLGRSQ
ncbi:uncharacterized protein LOC117343284 [Pecten maximus]|uniref:uncharacterized protein LOC117343284 n=1 Tax=Pecten maximus TaxID=6579 RepID=UPI001458842E|nr:uncharacterized protein LOC117343284 [Pecten maximus]